MAYGIDSLRHSVRVAGCYRRMLKSDEKQHAQVDPRLVVGQGLTERQLLDYQEERTFTAPATRLAALRAGDPVVVPAWFALPSSRYAGRRGDIPWLADRSVAAVWVAVDDMISPALPGDRVMAGRTEARGPWTDDCPWRLRGDMGSG